MDSSICGYPTAKGEPCQRAAGWGVAGTDTGPCRDHLGEAGEAGEVHFPAVQGSTPMVREPAEVVGPLEDVDTPATAESEAEAETETETGTGVHRPDESLSEPAPVTPPARPASSPASGNGSRPGPAAGAPAPTGGTPSGGADSQDPILIAAVVAAIVIVVAILRRWRRRRRNRG